MAKIAFQDKFKDGDEGNAAIGKLIFDSWSAAIEKNPDRPVIDRAALSKAVSEVVNTNDRVNTSKTIQVDFVFDTDLDENTRLVWIAVPTPDVDEPSKGGATTWSAWKQRYYDDLPPDERRKKDIEMGRACLQGCGR
ncbi:MAG: hypothetical protein HC855_03260 [Rhizobiales bacterium]|nr:hypothetical protein [Hyphomicrobiales bacterium]